MIIIDEKYCVSVDDCNYILQKRKIGGTGKSEGKEYYSSVGYYPSLEDALKAYYRETLRDTLCCGSMKLSEALKCIKEASEEVAKTIKAAIPEVTIKLN